MTLFERRGRQILSDLGTRPADVTDPSGVSSGGDSEAIQTSLGRLRTTQRWKSDVQAIVTLTTTAGDKSLPSVTIAGIPAGVTLIKVEAIMLFRAIEDTSGSANEIEAGCTPAVQVKETSAGTYTDAITVIDATLVVGASKVANGSVWFGNIDVKAEVNEDDTYAFQFDQADAVGNNLLLRDVQIILEVTWQV